MQFIKKLIPHVCITLSLVTLTFLILYRFNPGIFISPFFHVTLLVLCIVVLVASGFLIAYNKRA